jgi:hypothetical protein
MALIRGQEVKEGPRQIPANPRLYNMITTQAKSKFSKYPSPAAAHWVHAKYVQMGGKFVTSEREVDPRMRDYAHEAQEKKEEAAKKKVTKPVGKNVIYGERFKRL